MPSSHFRIVLASLAVLAGCERENLLRGPLAFEVGTVVGVTTEGEGTSTFLMSEQRWTCPNLLPLAPGTSLLHGKVPARETGSYPVRPGGAQVNLVRRPKDGGPAVSVSATSGTVRLVELSPTAFRGEFSVLVSDNGTETRLSARFNGPICSPVINIP
jgi:hypothetical protein